MRDSVPLLSVNAHTLSAVAAMPGRATPVPTSSVLVTFAVFASTRAMLALPQLGTHNEVNALIKPAHGLSRPVTGSPNLASLPFGSIFCSPSFDGIQTESVNAMKAGADAAS